MMEGAVTGGGGVTFTPYVLVEWANILVALHSLHTYSWSGPIFWWCYIHSIRTRGVGQYFGRVTFTPYVLVELGQYFGRVTFTPYVLVEWANILVVLHLFHTHSWNGPIFWSCYIHSIRARGVDQSLSLYTFDTTLHCVVLKPKHDQRETNRHLTTLATSIMGKRRQRRICMQVLAVCYTPAAQ